MWFITSKEFAHLHWGKSVEFFAATFDPQRETLPIPNARVDRRFRAESPPRARHNPESRHTNKMRNIEARLCRH